MRLRKTIGVLVFIVALGVAPAFAASMGAGSIRPITIGHKFHLLQDQDQVARLVVTVDRPQKKDITVGVDIHTHRDQVEDNGGGYKERYSLIADPFIARQDVYREHVPGTPCRTCGPIDTVCALIGDRC